MLLIVRHETNSKCLMMLTSFLEGRIDDFPTNAICARLKFIPEPATVSNGRVWKNRPCRNLRMFRCWSFLRPTEALIQWLTVESLKGCDPHAGVDEHLVNRFRPNDDHFHLRPGGDKNRGHERDKQRDSAEYHFLF